MIVEWDLVATLAVTSVLVAVGALGLLSLLAERAARRRVAAQTTPAAEEAIFLFDDHELVDATPAARALLENAPPRSGDWAQLVAFLVSRFDGFETKIATLARHGQIEMRASGTDPMRLRAEYIGGLARITLTDPGLPDIDHAVDGFSHRAMQDEITTLRRVVDNAPVLMWRQDDAGRIIWANRLYLMQTGVLDDDEHALTWPLPALFVGDVDSVKNAGKRRQRMIGVNEEKPCWYECHYVPMPTESLNFALPANDAVRAEAALREFVQTLTKTFAHLPIGLAIFDRQRQLALFNPALLDLTSVDAPFLSARPTLYAFLDRLRENRIIPEPKDYRSWRQKMTELEEAAASGQYQETWPLPSGQTYQVTGRPHPDGAVAFLIEDISAEVSLTRRFRTQLEHGQEILDHIDEAVAVFDPTGILGQSNTAYARLWDMEPTLALGDVSIIDAMRHWQALSLPNPIWGDLRDFVTGGMSERSEWSGQAEMKDGTRITIRITPMSSGATLVGFTRQQDVQWTVRRVRSRASRRIAAPCPAPLERA